MQFPVITYGTALYTNDSIPTKTDIEKIYEYASEHGFFLLAFSHSKTAISFNILLVLLILYLRNCRNISIFRSQITICMIHIHVSSMQFPVITWGMALYRQNTDVEKYASERGASELEHFCIFTF